MSNQLWVSCDMANPYVYLYHGYHPNLAFIGVIPPQNVSVLENHHWRSTIGMLRESRLLAHLPKEVT